MSSSSVSNNTNQQSTYNGPSLAEELAAFVAAASGTSSEVLNEALETEAAIRLSRVSESLSPMQHELLVHAWSDHRNALSPTTKLSEVAQKVLAMQGTIPSGYVVTKPRSVKQQRTAR